MHVFPSGCSVKPTGQLQRTPVDVSLQVQSHPPLLTAQVSESTTQKKRMYENELHPGEKGNSIPQCEILNPYYNTLNKLSRADIILQILYTVVLRPKKTVID